MSTPFGMNTSSYDEEAAEVARMKEKCDRMIHDTLAKIDALMEKIDEILRSVAEESITQTDEDHAQNCTRNLSLDELEVFMHGTQKLGP